MGTLNMKDLLGIQRALGFIEGICAGLKDKEAELIEEAITEIDCILEAVPGDSHVALPGNAPRNDSERGCEADASRMYYTTGEMDELVECLYQHHEDYGQGHAQNYHSVCLDCRNAADVITLLRQQLEDLEDKKYGSYMERP